MFKIATVLIFLAAAYFLAAQVAATSNVVFPLTELGDCQNEQDCRVYCDQINHIPECLEYAQEHNLLSKQEIDSARSLSGIQAGPGGCNTKSQCEAYCNGTANIQECVAFAEKHDVLPPSELQEAKAVAAYLSRGGEMPGNCQNKQECLAYCQEPSHMQECLDLAEALGMLSKEEVAEARKVLPFMVNGETPGSCPSKEACDAYCAKTVNLQECLDFAEKANLLPPEKLKLAKKVVPFIVRGETPGGCASEAECGAYCSQTPHFSECLDFAEKAGLMSKIEITVLRQALKLLPQ